MPFDHFDFLAPFYDNVIRLMRVEKLLEIAALPAPVTLLDAGGGTGRIAARIRPHVARLVIADLSKGMLAQAKQKDLTAACARSESLPFADNTFERVLMVDALHHVHDQKSTVRELFRVLKPDGRLVIEEPDIRSFSVKWIALLEKLTLMRSHFLNREKMIALFTGMSTEVQSYAQDHTVWVALTKK